jgi:glutathione peroxidase
MYSKIVVKGDETHELYKYLTSKKTNEEFAGEIQWNFTKFLIDRDGKVIARFGPRTKPDDAEVIKAIEDALAKGAG